MISTKTWNNVAKEPEGCWLWLGQHDRDGYAKVQARGRCVGGHRFFYEELVGPIPTGLTLDHICRNRICVNPSHMEPVTLAVNKERSVGFSRSMAHCIRGHAFSEQNTRLSNGKRSCRTCEKIRYRSRRALVAQDGSNA